VKLRNATREDVPTVVKLRNATREDVPNVVKLRNATREDVPNVARIVRRGVCLFMLRLMTLSVAGMISD
jgi:hypothetical protein